VTQLMTVQQVAEYLQMSNDKIYDMAQKGELPALEIRQQWRFNREEVDAWLKKYAVNSNRKQSRRKEKQ